MEDREKQVWQRVIGAPEGSGEGLHHLLTQTQELAAAYRQMAARATGRQRELLGRLLEGEQANAASLRGIGVLSGRAGEQVKIWLPRGQETAATCYHRTRKCLAEYMARSLDPEFGEVYRRLSQRAGQHCLWLTELAGLE